MARKIIVSFKETIEDIEVYNEIQSHGDKSCFVKDVIKEFLRSKKGIKQTVTDTNKNDSIDFYFDD